MPNSDWKERATCQGVAGKSAAVAEDFFPDVRVKEPPKVIEAFCRQCPVQMECLKEGVEGKEYGVWGGVLLRT